MEHQTPSGFPGNFRKRKVLGTLWFPSGLPETLGKAKVRFRAFLISARWSTANGATCGRNGCFSPSQWRARDSAVSPREQERPFAVNWASSGGDPPEPCKNTGGKGPKVCMYVGR